LILFKPKKDMSKKKKKKNSYIYTLNPHASVIIIKFMKILL